MGTDSETITISREDLKAIERLAVQEAKLDILVGDFQNSRRATDENVVKIYELIRGFPDNMKACRDDLEKDIYNELEKHYVTIPRIDALEADMINRFDKSESRSKWTIGLIVAAAGAVQFLTTMYFMSLQISKLAGGG